MGRIAILCPYCFLDFLLPAPDAAICQDTADNKLPFFLIVKFRFGGIIPFQHDAG